MKISNLIFKIATGLFFSIIYLSISYLFSYLNIYFEWGWKNSMVWFMIGFLTYAVIFENEKGSFVIDIIGAILNIGLILYIYNSNYQPELLAYFLINIIICLNIIIAVIRNMDIN